MTRPMLTTVLAVVALMLAGCSAPPATDPDGSEPAETTVSSAEPAQSEPGEGEPAETEPAETDDADASGADRQQCEFVMQERFREGTPRVATDDDIAASEAALGVELPAPPTCGVVTANAERSGDRTVLVFLDQPTVAPALIGALEQQGVAHTQEQGLGYVAEIFTAGDVTATVMPIGVDNQLSAWGQPWPGMDVTVLGVETP